MPVTALNAPASVVAGSTFVVEATGGLTNGCQSFERAWAERAGDHTRVWMIATERLGQPCTDDVREVTTSVSVEAGPVGIVRIVARAWEEDIETVVVVE